MCDIALPHGCSENIPVQESAGHYSELWTSGKAMFVCLNKVTRVRIYNYVREYRRAVDSGAGGKTKHVSRQGAQELGRKLQWMREITGKTAAFPRGEFAPGIIYTNP